MPKNYNIVTKTVKPWLNKVTHIGSSVAAGMTRYVTFIAVTQNTKAINLGSKIWFMSGASSLQGSTTAAASSIKKYTVRIPSSVSGEKHFQSGIRPDPENPLFSIAASKFLNVKQSNAQAGSASCTVFVQYYDQ